jgi:hypothetical protein
MIFLRLGKDKNVINEHNHKVVKVGWNMLFIVSMKQVGALFDPKDMTLSS